MNYYIIVEGKRSEKIIYPKWINYLNPNLREVSNIDELEDNCFYLISGFGYPYYLQIIDSAIMDMNIYNNINKLVIAVDSENLTYNEKLNQIQTHIAGRLVKDRVIIIIQHYCIETWALGNKIIIRRHPQDSILKSYLRYFNVIHKDPEQMESIDPIEMNRAKFTHTYLKRALNERYRNLSYTKNNPEVVIHEKYIKRIIERYKTTNHIQSFGQFYETFKY